MCKDCHGEGYVMQDIGTATIPDYVEMRCRCNPEPTDADAPDWRDDRPAYPCETPYPADLTLPVVDYDPPLRERIDGTLPARLLA